MSTIVQDQIVVSPADIGRLEALFDTDYLERARGRGLQLLEKHISPPVITDVGALTLWLRWEVADAGAWWAMRAQSGCPEVYAFWEAVDAFCLSRSRVYLTTQGGEELPRPAVTDDAADVRVDGYRETAQLALRSDSDAEPLTALLSQVASELPGLKAATLGQNLAPEYAAGHYTWDLLFADSDGAQGAHASTAWQEQVLPALERHCAAVHAFALDHIGGGLRDPAITNGVKRTAYFRLLPGTDTGLAATFEGDLLEMPRHMPDIRNWRLSKAVPVAWSRSDVTPWTYVWEQDFAALEGLTGPYMLHPHHWSHIDRWFDPESGDQIVDVRISHAFCCFESGVLARELVAIGT